MDGFFLYLVFVSIRPLSQLEVMYIIVVQLEVLIQLLLSETLFDFVGLHRPLANTTRFLNLILNWAPNPRISARLSSMRLRDWRGPASVISGHYKFRIFS